MKNKLSKYNLPIWLTIILLVVLILRIPSFFEPYSYGDEMIYLTLGQGVRQGIPLYSGLHDNKPPLLYITAAIAGNLFWFKAILAVWSLATITAFWKLVGALFPKNQRLHFFSVAVFAVLTTIPLLEGNIANAENFMIGPTIVAFYLILTKKSLKSVFLSGVLFSIATLFKIPAAFEVPVVIFYWLIGIKSFDKSEIIKLAKKTIVLSSGFLLPILLTFIWYFFQGALKQYFIAAFAQNFGYVSSWRPGDVQKPFLEKNAPLLIRGLIVFSISLFIFLKRKLYSKQFALASVWLLFALFAVTLSERPYPHYLLQAVPSISILVSMLIGISNYEQVLVLLPLSLSFFVPVYYHFWHYSTTVYYERFINLSLGKINKPDYLKTFGDQIPINYQVSEFLISSTKPTDKIFVWGDTSTIYAQTKRLPPIKYVADYHIRDFSSDSELIDKLNANKPEFIVILPNSNPPSQLISFITKNYGLAEQISNTNIWRLLNPKLRILLNSKKT
ncbi:MAG: hypothetical protein US62_C0009G0024 [Candidatus Woesebacteria bacterium GW2011_GWA1_37_8]|uniref:Glycosyltransferase RgtA/B/C/D-like domain-containing protein n=2 Tax=Candidatus Woeseibacteriota TaxID=1752722 RepID=A0A0G0PBN9_9BACT|nr:MAG: hypothetical protein US62_C0009G0024 [Candidatus Woesebacteria bacterium GW2011_GWA1_37_8]KKQ86681.1 MAG: hypothetical protein UT10_C0019G0041 [Candidatus Woesebacteria bacterium GW2011_GWB1_38_8b]